MIEVDRAMIEDFKIELLQMMENAGRNLANLASSRFLENNPMGKNIVILSGSGGNGGGVLVCARHLHNQGANVTILLSKPENKFTDVPRHQLEITQHIGITHAVFYPQDQANSSNPSLIVDGIIGYSLNGAPRGISREMILWANKQKTPILSLDIPSGMDASHGFIHEPYIQCTATMTLALPKTGFYAEKARGLIPELYLADISVPPELYKRDPLNLDVGFIFSLSPVVRLW